MVSSRTMIYPDHNGSELLAFVSPKTLTKLQTSPSGQTPTWFRHANFKKLQSPNDPSSSASTPQPVAEPTTRVLNSATREEGEAVVTANPGDIYIGASVDIPNGHIIYSALPDGLEEWDLVK
jgi:peroxin-1